MIYKKGEIIVQKYENEICIGELEKDFNEMEDLKAFFSKLLYLKGPYPDQKIRNNVWTCYTRYPFKNELDEYNKLIICAKSCDNIINPSNVILEYINSNFQNELIELYNLGFFSKVRASNIGTSNYAKHIIQPWSIWMDWDLNPWDADIIKRTLRTKSDQSRKEDYEKIIHICNERIRQLSFD